MGRTDSTGARGGRPDPGEFVAAAATPLTRPSGERIRAIRATQVNIPLVAPYRWSVGSFVGLSKTIVEVETTSGVIGLGEAPSWTSAPVVTDLVAPKLIGADPVDLADCERRALPPIRVMRNAEDDSVLRAFGAVEMALWDVAGQLAGRSVASLLGGAVRSRVSFTEYFAFRHARDGQGGEETPAAVAAYCGRMAEQHGSQAFEGKLGVTDLATELRLAREVRSAIGEDAVLRFDANMAWNVSTARAALHGLERYNVRNLEDPVRTFEEMARLRGETSISFSTHDPALRAAVRLGTPDAFVINLAVLGGIRRSLAFIHACEEMGVEIWFYSPDTGVANAAYLQVAAATPWISNPSQTLLRWHTDDVIEGGPFVPVANEIAVPDGPGLGVRLDRAALQRCHRRFVDDGPYDEYGDPGRPGRYGGWI